MNSEESTWLDTVLILGVGIIVIIICLSQIQ